jgi:hypothetical protein
MSPNEIKEIIRVVVDYGWKWEVLLGRNSMGELVYGKPNDQELDTLLFKLARGEGVRLAPTHEWDWPVETRVDMPFWYRYRYTLNPASTLSPWDRRRVSEFSIGHIDYEYHNVAIHPLNPTMEPPLDWQPEGKRILK